MNEPKTLAELRGVTPDRIDDFLRWRDRLCDMLQRHGLGDGLIIEWINARLDVPEFVLDLLRERYLSTPTRAREIRAGAIAFRAIASPSPGFPGVVLDESLPPYSWVEVLP
jgi:hypothetical protein